MDMHGKDGFPNFDEAKAGKVKPDPDQKQPWRAILLPSFEGVPVPERRWMTQSQCGINR